MVAKFYSTDIAQKAREQFESVFSQHQIPDDITEHKLQSHEDVLSILVIAKLATSKNEARRLIQQKAVSLDGNIIDSEHSKVGKGVLKVGKRRFLKLI